MVASFGLFTLGAPTAQARWKVFIWVGVAIWSLSMMWLSITSRVQSDYVAYIEQWKLVLSGTDPWSTSNAYGPLHNVFAYLLPLSDLAPRILFGVMLIIANGLLVREIIYVSGVSGVSGIYLLAVSTNFLITSAAFTYGLNDSLVAVFIIFAILARVRGYLTLAGCMLGIAIILKYYPVFLVPLFALERGRFRPRIVAGASIIAALGLAVALLVWGESLLRPLILGVNRDPVLLSILSSLQSYPSFGRYFHPYFLSRHNAEMVLIAEVAVIVIAWKLRLHWLEASVIGLLMIFIIYKVGQHYYYIPWLFLVASLPFTKTSSGKELGMICLPFVLFLSAFQWGYNRYDYYYDHVIIRQIAGFIAFPLGTATIVTYLWKAFWSRSAEL